MRSFSVFLLALLAVAMPGPVFSEPLPKIDVAEHEFDFGEVFQGEKVTHVFTFANRGEAPLVIDRVKSSCGCTAALLSAKEIAPQEEGTIRATFDSSRFRGNVHKTIMLYSNSPGDEVSRFAIKGKVKPLTESDPARLRFGKIRAGSARQLSFTLVNRWDRDLAIENIRTSNTAVTVTTDANVLTPGVAETFVAVARPVAATPHLRGYVLIRTDHAALGEIRVPIQGVVDRQ